MAAKVGRAGINAWGEPEFVATLWNGVEWCSWAPATPSNRIVQLKAWEQLALELESDAGSHALCQSATYYKVSAYLTLQNETDASAKVSYWKNRG